MQDLAAVINNNAHGVGAANSSNTDSALGLYPALSMLNHSCLPNCVFASRGELVIFSRSQYLNRRGTLDAVACFYNF